MDDESAHWLNLYEKMSDGKLDCTSELFTTLPYEDTAAGQEGHGDIELVAPSAAQIDQAKTQLKRKISQLQLPAAKRQKRSTKKCIQARKSAAAAAAANTLKKGQYGGKKTKGRQKSKKKISQKGGAKKARARKTKRTKKVKRRRKVGKRKL